MSKNLKIWDALKTPPKEALKEIDGGRLKGMTDISPQWRYKAMTEQFGPCGVGWKYEVVRVWNEPGSEDQVFAFAEVKVTIRDGDNWSEPIPGIGGSMLVNMEKAGLHASDEAYKMAITDALSVALKMLGVGADVYMGISDSKHMAPKGAPNRTEPKPPPEHSEKDVEMRVKLMAMLVAMAEGDATIASDLLVDYSTFEKKSDGKTVKGKRDPKDLSPAWLKSTYGKVKTAHDEWFGKQKQAEPEGEPSDEDIPF